MDGSFHDRCFKTNSTICARSYVGTVCVCVCVCVFRRNEDLKDSLLLDLFF